VAGQFRVVGMLTEQRSVGHGSITALVDHRHSGSDGFLLGPGESRSAESDRLIYALNGLHGAFVYGHDFNNVAERDVLLPNPCHWVCSLCVGFPSLNETGE